MLRRTFSVVNKTSIISKINIVYTDGACSNNGFPNAKAGIGVFWGDNDPRNVSKRIGGRQTNNRAEIKAAIHAIEQAKQQNLESIIIRTDSELLYKGALEWGPKWQNNDWKREDGKFLVNKEDFIALYEASKGIKVNYEKVPAHSKIHGNEEAHRLANKAIK